MTTKGRNLRYKLRTPVSEAPAVTPIAERGQRPGGQAPKRATVRGSCVADGHSPNRTDTVVLSSGQHRNPYAASCLRSRYFVCLGVLFGTGTLGLSLAAIVISAVAIRHQADYVRRSNVLVFMANVGGRSRTAEFREAQDYVLRELSQYDSALGITQLPRPARDHVWQVGGFYQDLGALVATGVIDEELAAALHYTGIKDTWRALEPYIRAEREHRRGRNAGGFFGSFESLAAYVESVSADQVLAKFLRRRFPHQTSGAVVSPVDASGDVDAGGRPLKPTWHQPTRRRSG